MLARVYTLSLPRVCARALPLIGAEESIQPLERFLFVEAKRVSFFHVVVVVVVVVGGLIYSS